MNPKIAVALDMISWTAMIALVWFGPSWATKIALSFLILLHIIILSFMMKQYARR